MLELGSGVGLTGISVCRSCSPARFVFTDSHRRVLQTLRDNVRLNGLDRPDGPTTVRVDELDWEAATEERLREIGANVVIGAGNLVSLCAVLTRNKPPNISITSNGKKHTETAICYLLG